MKCPICGEQLKKKKKDQKEVQSATEEICAGRRGGADLFEYPA